MTIIPPILQRRYNYTFYCKKLSPKEDLFGIEVTELAHDVIGDKYYQIAQHIRAGESVPDFILKSLGVHPKDSIARLKMNQVCHFLVNDPYLVLPSKDAGVFYVFEDTEDVRAINYLGDESKGLYEKVKAGELVPKAFFKVGRKRAQLELVIRRVSSILKLQEHTIFGMFAALKIPTLPPFWDRDSSMTEDLWNGSTKMFAHTTNKGHIVGILEPFIPSKAIEETEVQKIRNYARLTILAICIGLRDANLNNIINGKVFIDVEECFPERLDPDPSQKWAKAAHNLRYLFEDPLCQVPIPLEILEELFRLVEKLDVLGMASSISRLKKVFSDLYHDETDISDLEPDELAEDSSDGSISDEEEVVYDDEGGCRVQVEEYVKEPNSLFPVNRSSKVFYKNSMFNIF